ncbi:hypothetical protein [Streptomyces sp. NPDC058155]|uniref:hypothetical protein n=1 Tax=Streptomyces sp. NPDC058155 TaxID=3346359 RepID=UPI0036EACCD6
MLLHRGATTALVNAPVETLAFRSCVEEPAFANGDHVPAVTACIWRETADTRWSHGTIDFPAGYDDPDGANRLFHLLVDSSPEAYQRFAEDYYEVPVNLAAVRHVYALRPLTPALVSSLNAATTLSDVAEEIVGLDYPGPENAEYTGGDRAVGVSRRCHRPLGS